MGPHPAAHTHIVYVRYFPPSLGKVLLGLGGAVFSGEGSLSVAY